MEEKVMLKDLIEEYKTKKTDVEKKAFFSKNIKVTEYVDYAMKVAVSRSVIKQICLDEESMEFSYKTPERYLGFVIASIDLYTNIDLGHDEDDYSTYDLLKTGGFLEDLFEHIKRENERDYSEFSAIWNMCFDDLKTYYSSIEVLLRKTATRFALLTEVGMNRLTNALNSFDVEAFNKGLEGGSSFVQKIFEEAAKK